MGLFLISLIPAGDFDLNQVDDSTEALDRSVKRVEIAADPNSIQDLQSPTVSQGFERVRDNTADSIIGLYTESGLIPSVHLPNSLTQPRSDLAMVIVDGDVGIWDARLEVESSAEVEIRTTIPPSGFLVQGTTEELNKLEFNSVVVAVHPVPTGLLVHPLLTVVEEGSIMVEILGWKDDNLQRHMEPGLGLSSSLTDVASKWLIDEWSPEDGRFWGEIDLSNLAAMIEDPAVAYVAPLPVQPLICLMVTELMLPAQC
ncbi:MAG: hypothetical protein EB157_03120 [Euryarchaeota archaeon]|nr:hypothetical protein [Euryarchaeota archaeon]